ncbi:MAG TPA: hypothetical protein GX405_05980 [Rhizobiales bacterium]|nr:hypothetical protein [Hyphomicrobiales bacterium]
MKNLPSSAFPSWGTVAVVSVLAAATGLAFAAWIEHGAEIFLATVEAGLAWCF